MQVPRDQRSWPAVRTRAVDRYKKEKPAAKRAFCCIYESINKKYESLTGPHTGPHKEGFMFKKTATAYDLAQKFLQKGDARKARLAMYIGDRFQKIAEEYVERADRLHPAIVEGDLEATNRNLNKISDMLRKVHARVSKVDSNVFSGLGGGHEKRRKDALEHLNKQQGVLDAVKSIMSTNMGRKSLEANMALEHLKEIIEEDIRSGMLEGEDVQLMEKYIAYLQPKTGLDKDKPHYFRTPPGEII